MNIKTDLTKYVAEQLNLESDEKNIKKLTPVWWQSSRQKSVGGLRLTAEGFHALSQAEIKSYKILFDTPPQFTNRLIIWLDRFIDCPWYITSKEIWVFSERAAIQLVLFSGNIAKFTAAKANRLDLVDKQ